MQSHTSQVLSDALYRLEEERSDPENTFAFDEPSMYWCQWNLHTHTISFTSRWYADRLLTVEIFSVREEYAPQRKVTIHCDYDNDEYYAWLRTGTGWMAKRLGPDESLLARAVLQTLRELIDNWGE